VEVVPVVAFGVSLFGVSVLVSVFVSVLASLPLEALEPSDSVLLVLEPPEPCSSRNRRRTNRHL